LKSASATVLSSAVNPSQLGDDIVLTATVSSLTTVVIPPSGAVDFYEGAALLGSAPLNGSGQATLTVPGMSLGSHNLTADFNGDVNYAPSSGALVQDVIDTVPPRVTNINSVADTGDGMLSPGEGTRAAIRRLLVTFSEDIFDPAGNANPDDVTNPANYSLILDPAGSATLISIDNVAYSSVTDTAILDVNAGAALGTGSYRFTARGTPSIQDTQGNPLDGNGDGVGGDDFSIDFSVLPDLLPETGFAPGRLTQIPAQPKQAEYLALAFRLVIPELGIDSPIVGAPLLTDGWDISWLGSSVGYLQGTAFPTWAGNTVLTGHVYLPSGLPGPFVHLDQLSYGDLILIEAWGQSYSYSVREMYYTLPDTPEAFEHLERDGLTLVTCRNYNPSTGQYDLRTVVRAVRVSFVQE
jgi:LPXTG-site transpeptidase (sortase) family protein